MPLDGVRLRPPVPKPTKLICAAVNYLEFGQREPAVLDAFLKSPTAVIGSGDTCELPPAPASVFHHEPELALVIGRTATKVSQDEALSYIFGYCNFLDMSARGLRGAVGNSFFLGKCWDTFAPMGPALVTADEVADPQNVRVRLWNNDEPRHDFPTSDMAHPIRELIAEFSKITTLEPGDVILFNWGEAACRLRSWPPSSAASSPSRPSQSMSRARPWPARSDRPDPFSIIPIARDGG